MNCWGVLGGGFGLYGYLPCLVQLGAAEIAMLSRHRLVLESRGELAHCRNRVKWCLSIPKLLATVDSLVLAVPPVEQETIVQMLAPLPRLRNLLLEKPLAVTPHAASGVLQAAKNGAHTVRVGYTFLQTDWADKIISECRDATNREYSIDWRFRAHHFQSARPTWKSRHLSGGGPLRFYGIHLLAVLAAAGFGEPESSVIGVDRLGRESTWRCDFAGANRNRVTVQIDSASEEARFQVTRQRSESPGPALASPFSEGQPSSDVDVRVPYIARVFRSFAEPNEGLYSLYENVIDLWTRTECATAFVQQ